MIPPPSEELDPMHQADAFDRRNADVRPEDTPFALLIQRIGEGDRIAFGVVYDRLAAPVHRIARRRGIGEPEADAVVEAVLLRLWRTAPRFDPATPPIPWVLAILGEELPPRRDR